ncbi:MAG TPA: Holliday junction resolvase RuvX, partial [Agitococcus sp.]|nr:Holliday junction resolvase RuvX [Agitococcus sp.]
EQLIKEWQPQLLLVGLPLNMDDSESELSHLARKFGRRLHHRFNLPVLMVDERLTSRSAKEMLKDIGQQRKGKLPSLDSTAAVLMVEGWLAAPATGLKP